VNLEVTFDADRRVAHLVFNRPEKHNALSLALLRELIEACGALNREPDLRVVVVRGAGDRAFSAGFDLGDLASGDPSGAQLGFDATEALDRIRAVTIAAVRGHCIGGGVVFASACDLRIAADTARFAVPEIDVGIPLAWSGLPRLVRELGPAVAKELVITGRPFSPDEALAWRFVNAVVPAAELDDHVAEVAATIASKPRFAVLATKQQVRVASEQMIPTYQNDLDRTLIAAAAADPESRATMRRYVER
jgi:enoyl-CoA hydratase/carnithine racemase